MQALSASQSLGNGEDFFARPVVVFIFASVALNYGLSFITNTISMGISIQAMMKFGTNAPAYFEAMKTIAGPVQLDALQSTLALVDGYKVGQALEEIDKFLKVPSHLSCLQAAACAVQPGLVQAPPRTLSAHNPLTQSPLKCTGPPGGSCAHHPA